jgi:hypothetical protein
MKLAAGFKSRDAFLIDLYSGRQTWISGPSGRALKARGRDPATSPKPPTLTKGAISELRNRTFSDFIDVILELVKIIPLLMWLFTQNSERWRDFV